MDHLQPLTPPGDVRSLAPVGEGYGYRAFGLSVQSDIELPGFLEADMPGPPDVVVRRAPIDPDEIVRRNASGDVIGTAPPGILRAVAENGMLLTVDPDPEADTDFVAAVVSGELFAALLRQRGLLVLHGSAVARDGRAIGFLGNSGWGKSTLAAALVGRGWRLLTDDLLVVAGLRGGRAQGVAPTVVAGHPSMRLASEAADRLAERSQVRHTAHTFTTKVRMDWDSAFLDETVALDRLFVLDPRLSELAEVVPMPTHVAVLELAQHTRVRRLLTSLAYQTAHLEQCSDLARSVPVAYLRREFGLEHMADLCDRVEEAVEAG